MSRWGFRRSVIVALSAGAGLLLAAAIVTAMFADTARTHASPARGDHWHALYDFSVCGIPQPPAPTWEGTGVHTHADGVIHIHPFTAAEEGRGARLVKWFEYGGGKLNADEVRLPGSDQTYRNGDECPGGPVGVLQVFVNGRKLADWSEYIPQNGDRVSIIFGAPAPPLRD